MRFVVTKTLTDQGLPPVRMHFDQMANAYLFIIEAVRSAMRSRRVFDVLWVDDDHVALTSPTGRFLEEYTIAMEEGT